MASKIIKTLQKYNKQIYVALVITLSVFLLLDYFPALEFMSSWVTPFVALFLGLAFSLLCGQAHPNVNKKTS